MWKAGGSYEEPQEETWVVLSLLSSHHQEAGTLGSLVQPGSCVQVLLLTQSPPATEAMATGLLMSHFRLSNQGLPSWGAPERQ